MQRDTGLQQFVSLRNRTFVEIYFLTFFTQNASDYKVHIIEKREKPSCYYG